MLLSWLGKCKLGSEGIIPCPRASRRATHVKHACMQACPWPQTLCFMSHFSTGFVCSHSKPLRPSSWIPLWPMGCLSILWGPSKPMDP